MSKQLKSSSKLQPQAPSAPKSQQRFSKATYQRDDALGKALLENLKKNVAAELKSGQLKNS